MDAVSTISTMKVDCPVYRSSWRPTRVKTRSTSPIVAERAGTKLPIWAISTMSATCLMYVDLPAMLGPVRSVTWASSLLRYESFGTKVPGGMVLSTTGCLPSLMSMTLPLSRRGRT